jgi:hypothetical protein
MTRPIRAGSPAVELWTRRDLVAMPDEVFDEFVAELRAERQARARRAAAAEAEAKARVAQWEAKQAAAPQVPARADEPFGHPQPAAGGRRA